jgi:hypothetical protein
MCGLMLSLQLLAISFLATSQDTDAAVAVAIGLAHADRVAMEVPAAVEVAAAKPATNAEAAEPQVDAIELVRSCDRYGCRLVPRPPKSGTSDATPRSQDAAELASTVKQATSECVGDAHGRRAKWRPFGRRR